MSIIANVPDMQLKQKSARYVFFIGIPKASRLVPHNYQ